MADSQTILNDIERGKDFLSTITHNEILTYQMGIDKDKCETSSECLLYIIKALEFRTNEDLYDATTQSLWRCLVKIIGSYVAPVQSRFYYGLKDTPDTLTESEILSSTYVTATFGSNPIINFGGTNPQYNWMAELIAEPVKTKWQDTVVAFNNGNIGTIEDTFGPISTVGQFRFYDTQFETQFSYPIQFKVS